MKTKNTSVALILRFALERIESDNCRSGCYAIDCAIDDVGDLLEPREDADGETDHPAYDLFEEVCKPEGMNGGDYWFQTKEERIAGFKKAIAVAKERNL